MEFGRALELVVNECIHNGISEDFLKQNRAEVLRMSIFEYDQEEHIRQEREESWEEGMEQGREEGTLLKLVQQTLKKIQKGWTAERIAELLEEDLSVIKRICDIAKKYEPDYQESMICSELFLQKNN